MEMKLVNILKEYSSNNFTKIDITKDYSDFISDWKQIKLNDKIFNFMRVIENNNGNKFIICNEDLEEIGFALLNCYDKNFEGCYLDNIRIDDNYRRMGLATKLYEYIEGIIGQRLKPSPIKQSPDIKKVWSKRNF